MWVCVWLCVSWGVEERECTLLADFIVSDRKQVVSPDPSPSHLGTCTHIHTQTHTGPHHTSSSVVQVLIPSVSMVSGWRGSVWCQAVASTSLTPSLQDKTDTQLVCVCVCVLKSPLEAYLRDDAIFQITPTHTCTLTAAVSCHPLILLNGFSLVRGLPWVEHLIAGLKTLDHLVAALIGLTLWFRDIEGMAEAFWGGP